MSFGDEMRQARQRKGMTQAELAQAVGASLSAVSNWERGINTRITAEARIRDVLDLNGTPQPPGLVETSDAELVASISAALSELTRRLSQLHGPTSESTVAEEPDLPDDPQVGGRRKPTRETADS